MALDLNDPYQVTYQVLWGTRMLPLWEEFETHIVKLPQVDQDRLRENLEHIFTQGYTKSVVSAIKYHSSEPEKWDTARHLIGEHKSIKAVMAQNREELRQLLREFSSLLSVIGIKHPKIHAAKKAKKKQKA